MRKFPYIGLDLFHEFNFLHEVSLQNKDVYSLQKKFSLLVTFNLK